MHATQRLIGAHVDGPRLLADIGGTNARFALELGPGRIDMVRVVRCADYVGFADALASYIDDYCDGNVHHAAVAIANPVDGDAIRMTNHHWEFSIEATRKYLELDTLLVINDFTALAMALPYLKPEECWQVGGGTVRAGAAIGLVGAGTGLGIGGLVPAGGHWIALNSEGGHATFSPTDERESAVLQYTRKRYTHVSSERLVSGPGIELIYEALGAIRGAGRVLPFSTPEIVERGLSGHDSLCSETLDCFCAMLGTVASNVALMLGAQGGVYIGGGVVPRLGDYFERSPFRERFEKKGRFSGYLSQVSTTVITAPYPAFAGVAAILSEHLAAQPVAG